MGCRKLFILLWPLLVFLISTGCMKTSYTNIENSNTSTTGLMDRQVSYWIDPRFHETFPRCVLVLMHSRDHERDINNLIMQAFERYLGEIFETVIGFRKAKTLSRTLAIDFFNQKDRILLAKRAECKFYAEIDIENIEDQFALIWAKRSIKLSIKLTHATTGEIVFKAKHIAQRSNGGLPLSAIGVPISITQAAMVRGDPETFHSLADDAARRMLLPLPSFKN
jgi:hypothetical protein